MKRQPLRHIIQTVFFILTLGLVSSVYTGIIAIAHAVCPNSVICFGVSGIKNGSFAFIPAIIAGLVFLVSTIFFGRFFCGYVCFFGTLNEFMYKLFHKKKNKSQKISPIYERKLNIVKYIVFSFTLVSVLFFTINLYKKVCPVMVVTTLNQIAWQSIIILIIFTIVAAISSRFWCRFLCPYATLMNIFQYFGKLLRIRRVMIHRNMEVCIDCLQCDKACPMNIVVSVDEVITDPNCIHCGECTSICPKPGALLEKMPIKKK